MKTDDTRKPEELLENLPPGLVYYAPTDPVKVNGKIVERAFDIKTRKPIRKSNYKAESFCSLKDVRIYARCTGVFKTAIAHLDGVCAIRIEECLDDDGKLTETAAAIVGKMDSYTEVSPDGTGVTILFKCDGLQFDESIYDTENAGIEAEIYLSGYTDQCVTVTGDVLTEGLGLEERSKELQEILDLFFKKKPVAPTPIQIPKMTVPQNPVPVLGEHRFDFMRTCDDIIAHTPDGEKKLSELGLRYQTDGRYSPDIRGMANLFFDCYFKECCYIPGCGWHHYNGKYWEGGSNGESNVKECAKEFTAALLELTAPDRDDNKVYWKFVQKLQETGSRDKILRDAESLNPVPLESCDRQKHLLNCQNGTLNLLTRELRPHDPKDLITKIANVTYDPNAQCKRWLRFVEEIFDSDQELISYFRKVIAYAITGFNQYEKCFICYGPTSRNGKTSGLTTIACLLGEGYAKMAYTQTFAQKSFSNGGSGASEDLARLAGARLAVLSEPEQNMVLSNTTLKSLTGRNRIVSRNLYKSSFEYVPEFKIIFDTNFLPRTSDPTLFRSGRICVIPFNHQFLGEHQDKNLKDELQSPESLSGILNWALDGLDDLMESGFEEPPAVVAATKEYERQSDKVGRFIDDMLYESAGGEIPSDDIYKSYSSWCQSNGCFPVQASLFKEAMIAHGGVAKKKRPANKRLYGANSRNMILGFGWRQDANKAYLPPYIYIR